MKILILLNFIVPFVMLLVGYLLKRKPISQIGSNGYSTPSSRKSQERWDYAQFVAPHIFIVFGFSLLFIIILLSVFFLYISISVETAIIVGNTIGFSGLGISFYTVERKISFHFDKQ